VGSIRTVVVTMPPLLTEIIEHSLIGRIVLHVVARFDNRDFSKETLRGMRPDLVLIGLRPGESDTVGRSLLALVPAAKVIAFSSDARHGYIHEMRAHRAAIINISPQALIEAILGASAMKI
jgi:chemotaxis response regulator CheB